jgi:hypothetical protein
MGMKPSKKRKLLKRLARAGILEKLHKVNNVLVATAVVGCLTPDNDVYIKVVCHHVSRRGSKTILLQRYRADRTEPFYKAITIKDIVMFQEMALSQALPPSVEERLSHKL